MDYTPRTAANDTNPNNNTATDTDTPAPGSISGHKFLDVTGNGASGDDTPYAGGVTINLYKDVNNSGVLDASDGSPIKTTTTAKTGDIGAYSFTGLAAVFLSITLHHPSHALAGAVLGAVYASAVGAQIATAAWPVIAPEASRGAMKAAALSGVWLWTAPLSCA